jgi:hypothetical protein
VSGRGVRGVRVRGRGIVCVVRRVRRGRGKRNRHRRLREWIGRREGRRDDDGVFSE